MDPLFRKRNASDGDSGFDSALSSRSSSISLEDQQEYEKLSKEPINDLKSSLLPPSLRFLITADEDIFEDGENPDLFSIVDKVSGSQVLYKPPSRLKFSSSPPQYFTTYSSEEYLRCDVIPRSKLFQARLEYELEKQIEGMDLVEVDLNMSSPDSKHPPSLGIRVIGVNMIHGIKDKLNIYVKRVLEDSVAGQDGRIRVNDQIVQVNGVSLVGVGAGVAATSLSNCSVLPDTQTVHFLLARPKVQTGQQLKEESGEEFIEGKGEEFAECPGVKTVVDQDHHTKEQQHLPEQGDNNFDVRNLPDGVISKITSFLNERDTRSFTAAAGPTFEGRHAVRLMQSGGQQPVMRHLDAARRVKSHLEAASRVKSQLEAARRINSQNKQLQVKGYLLAIVTALFLNIPTRDKLFV